MAERSGCELVGANVSVRSVSGGVSLEAASGKEVGITVAGVKVAAFSAAGLGYSSGQGGAQTQATDRTTTVVLSKLSGAITTAATSLAAGAEATFTVTNTLVAATDVVVVCLKTPSATGLSLPFVSTVADGSFQITLTNLHGSTADTSASVINFVVIKAVAA